MLLVKLIYTLVNASVMASAAVVDMDSGHIVGRDATSINFPRFSMFIVAWELLK